MSNQMTEGRIDNQGQPVISVRLIGIEDPYTALIDTGFNGDLIIYEEHAREAELTIERGARPVTLADGSRVELVRADGVIEWFGEQCRVIVFLIPGPAPRHGRWQIGTQLLRDCRLEIDFRERSVRLSRHT